MEDGARFLQETLLFDMDLQKWISSKSARPNNELPMSALLFVYNADSGLFNTLTDTAHKVFSPSTYACNLYAITHTPFGMRGPWKKFLAELGQPLEFLHRDEFRRRLDMADASLPAIFRKQDDGRIEVLIDAATINAARSIDDLANVIRAKLAEATDESGRSSNNQG